MWNSIRFLTGYKSQTLLPGDHSELPHVLNHFLASFDAKGRSLLCLTPPAGQLTVVKQRGVRDTENRS